MYTVTDLYWYDNCITVPLTASNSCGHAEKLHAAPSKIDRFAQLDVAGALFRGQKLALLDHFKLYAATREAPPPSEPPLVDIC